MNCKYCQNEKCIMRGIPNEFHRKCPDAIATNADRINAMTNEEKASFFALIELRFSPKRDITTELEKGYDKWLDWLKQG